MSNNSELLSNVSIFKGLSPKTLEILASSLQPLSFSKNSIIVGQDDHGDALYIIASGKVKVVLYGETGRKMILTTFRAGDFFGEMSLLDGQPRSANVIAIEDTNILKLSREDFVRHLEASPATALNILCEMSLRLRRADDIIGNLALLDVYGRLAHVLIDIAQREGQNTDAGFVIRSRPSQKDLAAMIGTTRETVSRVLSEFQRRGFLFIHGKKLLLGHGFVEQPLSSEFPKK
ncbi:MAG: Crp/Fnr family transcriptional regulator [Deltaproteobacteria bacterium]|nr:Crp/Fnr family transcriptional regulator [Deltaproteobacteria bacterium]